MAKAAPKRTAKHARTAQAATKRAGQGKRAPETPDAPTGLQKPPTGWVYVLWMKGSFVIKVGFTSRSVRQRALGVQSGLPFPVLVVGARAGTRADERWWHRNLARWRTRGEWYRLPNEVSLLLAQWAGMPITAEEYEAARRADGTLAA